MLYFEILPIELVPVISKFLPFSDIKCLSEGSIVSYKTILIYLYPKMVKGGLEFCKLIETNEDVYEYILSSIHDHPTLNPDRRGIVTYISYDVLEKILNYRTAISYEFMCVDTSPRVIAHTITDETILFKQIDDKQYVVVSR